MSERDIIRRLRDLAQMDVEAANVYDEALERAGDDEVRARFLRFSREHQNHADSLSRAVQRMGAAAVDQKVDLAERMAEAYSVIRIATGTDSAVRAMHGVEREHVRRYEEAARLDVPPEVHQLLERFLAEERQHLAYLEEKSG